MRADNGRRHPISKALASKAREKVSGAQKKKSSENREGDATICGSEELSVDEILKQVARYVMAKARPSVADLVRLLELRRELAQSDSESLTVKWIDRCEKPESEE